MGKEEISISKVEVAKNPAKEIFSRMRLPVESTLVSSSDEEVMTEISSTIVNRVKKIV